MCFNFKVRFQDSALHITVNGFSFCTLCFPPLVQQSAVCKCDLSSFMPSQVGDQHINTTTCGCPCWAHCSAALSCLSSTGGLLCSHTALKSSSTYMSQSRSQVSCVLCVWKYIHDAGMAELTCRDSFFLSRCELGFVHAGGDICECSRQRSVSVWCRGSRQELQVRVCIAWLWVQTFKTAHLRRCPYQC